MVYLVYVDGPWAWFAERPGEAWGDDWDDAPHEANAGTPYPHKGGRLVKVAYDGDWEVYGVACGVTISVEDINAGVGPWLHRPYADLQELPGARSIHGQCELSAFEALVVGAGGRVYHAGAEALASAVERAIAPGATRTHALRSLPAALNRYRYGYGG